LGLRKTTKIFVVRTANIWTENKTREVSTEGQLTFGYIENIFINNIILLTPRSRILLEKVAVPHLANKFPAFYGTRRFISAFTRGR